MADSIPLLQQSFARVLREARTEAGLSQEKLALESGLDRTFISLLERGLRQPSLGTLVMLGEPLNVEAAELVRATVAGLKRRK